MAQTKSKEKKVSTKAKAVEPWTVKETAVSRVVSDETVIEKALSAYERANATLFRASAVSEAAKTSAEEADAAHFEAFASTLAAAEALHAAVRKVFAAKRTMDQTPPLSLPSEYDIYDVEGFAGDKDGYFYLDPQGKAIRTEAMFRKIEKQDWNA